MYFICVSGGNDFGSCIKCNCLSNIVSVFFLIMEEVLYCSSYIILVGDGDFLRWL